MKFFSVDFRNLDLKKKVSLSIFFINCDSPGTSNSPLVEETLPIPRCAKCANMEFVNCWLELRLNHACYARLKIIYLIV